MPSLDRLTFGMAFLAVLIAGCSASTGKSFVPLLQGYHTKHQVYILPKDLLEISGLVHLGDLRFVAINDEDGELFFINLENYDIQKYRFKGKGDYEDIARIDNTFYVLESNGDIIEIPAPYNKHNTYKFGKKHMEFESLAYYQKENKLVMITKDQRNKTKGISAISFDLARKEFDSKPFFNISLKEVFTIVTNYEMECKPSAAAINPVNQKLYVIASVGKILIQCNRNGKMEKIYKINPAQFPQPEGIAFAANGDMYISNEGADGKATILKFTYGGQN
jgi:hypothetical protein